MALATVLALFGLAVVLFALRDDPPLPDAASAPPAWGDLPSPADLTRTAFALRYPGYDPAAVEDHLHRAALVLEDLLAVAPAEVLDRARARAAARRGEPPTAVRPPSVATEQVDLAQHPDREALTSEVVISTLDNKTRDIPPRDIDPPA